MNSTNSERSSSILHFSFQGLQSTSFYLFLLDSDFTDVGAAATGVSNRVYTASGKRSWGRDFAGDSLS